MILIIYDPIRDEHIRMDKDISRQFRDDLAFLCEYCKGGDACTAIGIEDRSDHFVYHVAANIDPANKILPFLESLLKKLQGMVAFPDAERYEGKEELTVWCIQYARPKLKKLRGILLGYIRRCQDRLKTYGSATDDELVDWLGQFENIDDGDDVTLCQLAYDVRNLDFMRQLEQRSRNPTYNPSPSDRKTPSPFSDFRHYIGRLADHIRVPSRLIDSLSEVQHLISYFDVRAIPVSAPVPAPRADNLTTVDSICGRVFKKDDSNLPRLQAELRQHEGLIGKLEDHYGKSNPRVHAEIQVAEHFYDGKLIWAEQDRYIGVSKPSCYGCQLYLKHHPANLEPRECHMKAYRNWGPPLLERGQDDDGYAHQLGILNAVIFDLRKDLIRQVLEQRAKHEWHADSHTAITSTVPDAELALVQTLALDPKNMVSSIIIERDSFDSSDNGILGLNGSFPRLSSPETVRNFSSESTVDEDSRDDDSSDSEAGASLSVEEDSCYGPGPQRWLETSPEVEVATARLAEFQIGVN
ncbi:hypothetical protein SBRCBS47491_003511 [Sporothrix bragantina]|uniref:Uncharacterized protein n=1 Tax=Sporothrix bragantina TaxID=671064 RepID=A0ABP0BGT2_9PEZI